MNPIEMSTGNRTIDYTNYRAMLVGIEIKEGNRIVDTVYYDPKTGIEIYHVTKYLQDCELQEINQSRIRSNYKPLPRLAYIGDGKYKQCKNQAEKKSIESKLFEGEHPNIEKLLQTRFFQNKKKEKNWNNKIINNEFVEKNKTYEVENYDY